MLAERFALKRSASQQLWEPLGRKILGRIRRRCLELMSVGGTCPKQVTKTALLKGFPRGNQLSNQMLGDLPKTNAAIEACIEPRGHFQCRYALAILSQLGDVTDLVVQAKERTGLSMLEVEQLNVSLLRRQYGAA